MATKVITRECPNCKLNVELGDDRACKWGNSKKPKRLRRHLGRKKPNCSLIERNFEQLASEVAVL